MKQVIYGFILIICSLSYQACDIFDSPCKFEEFVIPVEIYPMKDTFHVGNTMHVHIEFSDVSKYDGETYTIINDHINFKHVIGFVQDTNFVDETALKHSNILVDTSKFNVFKYQFSTSGDYSILGDIEKINGRYIVDYSFTLNDTGFIYSFFFLFSGGKESAVQLKGDCSVRDEILRLVIPPGEDDNYDLLLQDDNGITTDPGHKYEDYKNRAGYAFYVVE